MYHHIKGGLIDCSPEVIILDHVTNDLSQNASADDITSKIVTLGRSVKTEYNQVYISRLTVKNDKWEEKGKQVN